MFSSFLIPLKRSAGRRIAASSPHGGAFSALISFLFLVLATPAFALGSLRAGAMSSPQGSNSASATSQTATSATTSTSQSVQTSLISQHAQASLARSIQALQALQAKQAAASATALTGPNNLGANPNAPGQTLPNVPDGLGPTALMPAGGLTVSSTGAKSQLINLSNAGTVLSLGQGGTITLPSGTPGNDTVAVTGAGTITTTTGTVIASAGSLTTSTGGTLVTTGGGSVSVTGGSSTLVSAAASSLTSTIAGTVILPANEGTVALPANQAVTIPAGSSISFSGTAKGTVTLTGSATVTLNGAGTLTLANPSAASASGTITSNSGTISFTSGVSTSLPAGSRIALTGSGTVDFSSGTGGAIPVILPTTASYSTTGTLLSTVDYQVPTGGSQGWVNISDLSQSSNSTTGKITDTVTQDAPTALLYWSSFNIGKNTTLSFDQSQGGGSVGQWVAINQITDPSLAPSQILGAIQAPGQVYVINQNGIIFGGSSQVNVHTLVASSLPINSNLLNAGLLSGASTDDQFLFSQLTVNALSGVTDATPQFVPPAAPNGLDGDVTVQAGAQLTSPSNAEHVGGRIALVGPVVDNEGTISTPDGQAILAAGLQVGFEAHSQDDPTLRGLDVYVGKVTDPTYDSGAATDVDGVALGTAINGGVIDSDRADVTMTGKQVAQNGAINGSTSVTLNGRVDLLADYDAVVSDFNNLLNISPTASGGVSLGANSVTQILPELASTDTVVGTSLALPSLVNIQGQTIYLGSDAELLAPGASVPTASPALDLVQTALTSGVTLNSGSWNNSNGLYYFVNNSGQVYLDSGASIDVSGSADVAASVDEDIVAVQLLGTELADSPLQRNGPLRGQTIFVDIRQNGVYDGQAWIGTPLADASGYVGLIQHNVGELTANGGTVAINAGDSVVLQTGSEINVSAGYINYQGGDVKTTQVLTAGGQILGIAQATPNITYQGIYNGYTAVSSKYGLAQTFSNPLLSSSQYDAGYIQGGNGGSLSITAPAMALDGQLYGNTVTGSQQRTSASQLNAKFAGATFPGSDFVPALLPILAVPQSGTLSLSFTQNENPSDAITRPTTSPDVTIQTQAYLNANPPAAVGPFTLDSNGNPLALPTARRDLVVLSQDLVAVDGFNNLNINTSASGNLTLAPGVDLDFSPDGSLTFSAANIDLESNISAPGGSLSFTADNVSPYANPDTSALPDFTRGNFFLASGLTLSTAGLIVDDRPTSPTAGALPEITSGGSVTINSFSADLANGSSINTSGGAYVSAAGAIAYGNGGAITILAGTDPTGNGLLGGNLTLGASYLSGQSLESYSGAAGGTLTLQAPLIQVGGVLADPAPSINIGSTSSETGAAYTETAQTLLLSPSFFNQGGFANFTLIGLGAESAPNGTPDGTYLPAVVVAANTTVNPIVEGFLPAFSGTSFSLTPMTSSQAAQLLPSQRSPVNLTFSVKDLTADPTNGFTGSTRLVANTIVENGAVIETGPSASSSVTVKGDTVSLLGDVIAPGGKITVAGTSSPEKYNLNLGSVTVDLGPESLLSTAGETELTPNLYGYRTGTVLNGGTVSISGDLAAESGSVIDVSGWKDTLDVLPGYAGVSSNKLSAPSMVATTEASNGGAIVLTGGEELLNDATLLGSAGGSTAQTTAPGLAIGSSSAQGGSLTVSSSTVGNKQGTATPADPTLFVTQDDPAFFASGQPVIGGLLVDANGNPLTNGGGYVGVNRFSGGGFGSVTLDGVVQFSGPVNLAAGNNLNVGNGGFIYGVDDALGNPALINLTAPHVAVGGAFATPAEAQLLPAAGHIYANGSDPFFLPPSSGDGILIINASTLADVGNLSLQGIGMLNFNGTSGAGGFTPSTQAGDVRGDGTLDVAGAINLNARQVYPTTETPFNIIAYDSAGGTGTVNIYAPAGETLPLPPLSAGGTLNIYASVINQGGVLRAPIGTINLGSNGTGTPPFDLVAGTTVDPTQSLTLAAGSVTSVSADGEVIPYGSIDASGDWIDPAGNNIAAGGSVGLPAKLINISAQNITTDSGATIDISGGGDLYANEFVSGIGGTNNILAQTGSFAVLPSYNAGYAYAPVDPVPGYAASAYSNLQVGDRVYLSASNGLPAGFYTLLPAGYSLLPGGFLVTPKSGTPGAAIVQPDGSSLVSGYRTSGLNGAAEQPLNSVFEVAPQSVVNTRAEYDSALANTYFRLSAVANNVAVPRLPVDAGQFVLIATENLSLPDTQNTLISQPGTGGLGGEVDIASPTAINIYNNQNSETFVAGDLNLDAASLDAFDADSLLIGGYRTAGSTGTSVTVLTDNLTVDNAGEPLTGPDVILASNQVLTVGADSEIDAGAEPAAGAPPVAQNLSLTGNGAILRVSSDPSAEVTRTGVVFNAQSDPADVGIGAGAIIAGATAAGSTIADKGSVTLDSTNLVSLDPTAKLSANTLTIDSGAITIELPTLAAPITTAPTGLVISSASLATLQAAAENLSLLSYSTFDIYGSGNIGDPAVKGVFPVQNLAINAAEIRGFDNGGGTVTVNAGSVALGGTVGGVDAGPAASPGGALTVNANTIQLGPNALAIDQYSQVSLAAAKDILLENGTGTLAASGNLTFDTPLITADPVVPLTPAQEQQGVAASAPTHESITAGGALQIANPGGSAPVIPEGLHATVTLTGASVNVASSITLPSGSLTLHATGGDVTLSGGGALSVAGTAQPIYALTEYTNAGQLTLTSDTGNVELAAGSTADVAALPAGGNAGTLAVNAPQGQFNFTGSSVLGTAGASGQAGTFSLDVGSLPTLDLLDPALNAGGFSLARSIRVRTGDVALDDAATARTFNLSADAGSITVNGQIDASGATGGTIDLAASGSVTLTGTAVLTAQGQTFNAAGQGGSISLESGSETDGAFDPAGYVDLQPGSTINLSVAANTPASAAIGDLTGTLHIRAPAFADGSGLQVDPIKGTIVGASSVTVEGYKIYTPANGSIDSVEGSAVSTPNDGTVYGDAEAFANNSASIQNTLLNNTPNAAQSALFQIIPGAEIVNMNLDTAANPTAGDLTLAANWDLSTFRFGPDNVPGDLTLRAGGNLVLDVGASLSDGFTPDPTYGLWTATLMATPSWSYHLVAGADFAAADARQVLPESQLESRDANGNPILNSQGAVVYNGSVLLGYGSGPLPAGSATQVIPQYFQTIRTGTGNIDISAGGDVQLLNNLATIYTAGALDPDQTLNGTFDLPSVVNYPAQYSLDGGNVTISAQDNIGHYLANGALDSSYELPTNWLYRQGSIAPTGLFADTHGKATVQSTSWWTDFSNFFEGVGAFGGGNVSLAAGNDIVNVDAVIPTNARMPGVDSLGNAIAPNVASLVELGGGDLTVRAGDDINGGVYYVERGQGTLSAGNQVLTNAARSAVPLSNSGVTDPQSDLPTTLFLGGADGGNGSASFTVSAGSNLLLGPVANPFFLPQGVGNNYLEKTFFSTYASTDAVDASSLTGTVTLQDSSDTGTGSLADYYQNVLTVSPLDGSTTVASQDPFLGLIETGASVLDFNTVAALMAPTLQVTAFSGDIDTRGSLTLAPSPTGTLNLVAAGSLNGYQPNGLDSSGVQDFGSSTFDLADNNPAALPGIASPAAPLSTQSTHILNSASSTSPILSQISSLFTDETDATQGISLQTEEILHDPGILHANDPTGPVHLYAGSGDISGITMYAGKAADIVAGQDITDIAFYLQNVSAGDISLVEAGRDIIAYDINSPLRLQAQEPGNAPIGYDNGAFPEGFGLGAPNAGDIQIAGPGALEVLAGRNLDLGSGPTNPNGTAVGITSIGGSVNPYLPFSGADITAAAGIGAGAGLGDSQLTFTNSSGTGFIDLFLNPSSAESTRYLPDLATLLNLPSTDTDQQIFAVFNQLPVEQQDRLALDIFYLVLRDAGRDHNNPSSPDAGTYTQAYAAIASLFPGGGNTGSITLTSREIKTTNGGNIGLIAPEGAVNVGFNIPGAQPVDQGILTEDGGNISIFANGNVNVGTSRIFTLHGGNEILFSSTGNIDAGASSKTVQSAPPTRVLVYPTSGDVETDLAGLATGGGIGVLETVVGAPPGDVDLIAPKGIVNAGDAGIRASGDLNIAAVQVLNAGNISVGGKSTGVPAGASAPNIGALAAASTSAGAADNAAQNVANQNGNQALADQTDAPSIISVEVIGYGGGDQD